MNLTVLQRMDNAIVEILDMAGQVSEPEQRALHSRRVAARSCARLRGSRG